MIFKISLNTTPFPFPILFHKIGKALLSQGLVKCQVDRIDQIQVGVACKDASDINRKVFQFFFSEALKKFGSSAAIACVTA